MGDNKINKIGVMTSGGDAPGMNAALRAIVRTARHHGITVLGIKRGFEGLLEGDFIELKSKSVSNILNQGGTILKSARCKEMMTSEGQDKAANICKVLKIDTLFIIGGDGSLQGGLKLAERGVNIIGIPGTIDLDFPASDYTIGFDTAVNTAMEAINKIRDTTSSHERCSIVEVMGRNCGQIALWCGMTGGAEDVLIPETYGGNAEDVIAEIVNNRAGGKRHNLIVVAEGVGGSAELAKKIEGLTGIESRATILGHLQRGGAPTAIDKMKASLMGYEAVMAYLNGNKNSVIVYKDGTYKPMDIETAINTSIEYKNDVYDVIKVLSI